ncbi:hypothetical protein Bca4012_062263 [Brassica carinata]|uniref:Uncharacterized protein n=1 Tax=Brassica carinata TaxID=52824 RepID=A0A8X7SAJ3_BRACI|nr:hypothetical protein Bca52824_032165 [Brassica carinata]
MVDDDGEGSFKKPGAVPFNWEIRPGIPKTPDGVDVPTLLQPPKKLSPLRLKQLQPPSSLPSSPRPRAVSPFAPPPPYLKPKPTPASSGPPSPYWRSSSVRDSGSALPRWRLLKSLIGGMKKSKSRGDAKRTGDQDSTSSESGEFYESGTTFSPSEGSSRGSVATSWSSSSSSSLKRNESDLSSSERKVMLMMAREHLG